MSTFLTQAATAVKSVAAARKQRSKLESSAEARLAKARAAFDAAQDTYAGQLDQARQVEAAAWRALMDSLGVGVDMAAQIGGVDAAYVKSVLADPKTR